MTNKKDLLKAKRKELANEMRAKRAALRNESELWAIADALGIRPDMVHAGSKLYGSVGSVSCYIGHAGRFANLKDERYDTLRELVTLAPPAPAVSFKANFAYYMPRKYFDSKPDKLKNETPRALLDCVARVRVSEHRTTVSWWHELPDGRQITIDADISGHGGSKRPVLSVRRREIMGATIVESWEPRNMPSGHITRYGSGGREYAGEGAADLVTIADLLAFADLLDTESARLKAEAAERYKNQRAEELAKLRAKGGGRDPMEKLRDHLRTLPEFNSEPVTLERVQALGYNAISKSLREHNPDALKIGVHEVLNGLYFLLAPEDDRDPHTSARGIMLREEFRAATNRGDN